MHTQARSQDLEKRGGYFERVRSVQTTLTGIFIELEAVSNGLSVNWDEISRKARKFKAFFRPKSVISKKKKKKRRSSPKFREIFRPISQIQTFEGGLFLNGGAISHFSQEIGLKSTKNMRFCILHKPMGGLESPPPPLATLLCIRHDWKYHCCVYPFHHRWFYSPRFTYNLFTLHQCCSCFTGNTGNMWFPG